MTMSEMPDLYFGLLSDDDGVPDAEFDQASADLLLFYLRELAPPPRRGDLTDPSVIQGETVFGAIGCADCHIPMPPTVEKCSGVWAWRLSWQKASFYKSCTAP